MAHWAVLKLKQNVAWKCMFVGYRPLFSYSHFCLLLKENRSEIETKCGREVYVCWIQTFV